MDWFHEIKFDGYRTARGRRKLPLSVGKTNLGKSAAQAREAASVGRLSTTFCILLFGGRRVVMDAHQALIVGVTTA